MINSKLALSFTHKYTLDQTLPYSSTGRFDTNCVLHRITLEAIPLKTTGNYTKTTRILSVFVFTILKRFLRFLMHTIHFCCCPIGGHYDMAM